MAVSPINSPRRNKSHNNFTSSTHNKNENIRNHYSSQDNDNDNDNDLDDTDSNESVSIRTPPPAYREEEQSQKSDNNDAYSNLMSFLDDASASLPPPRQNNRGYLSHPHSHTQSVLQASSSNPPTQRSNPPPAPIPPLDIEITHNHDDIRDDLSSMSYSMTSSMQGGSKAFTSNKYIWNDLDDTEDDGHHNDRYSHSSRNTARGGGDEMMSRRSDTDTFFRAPPSYHSSASAGAGSTQSKNSLQSNVEEIKEKAKNMQQELRKKTQRMKDLQTEVTRLKAIKSRKATKLSEKYARELEELRSDNSKGLEKQKVFVDKLQEAVSTLNAKARNLSDKLESNGPTLSSRVAKAKEDGVREIRRAQSQWETDEKTVFDKLAHSKR